MGISPVTRKKNFGDCDLAISGYLIRVITIWKTDSVEQDQYEDQSLQIEEGLRIIHRLYLLVVLWPHPHVWCCLVFNVFVAYIKNKNKKNQDILLKQKGPDMCLYKNQKIQQHWTDMACIQL